MNYAAIIAESDGDPLSRLLGGSFGPLLVALFIAWAIALFLLPFFVAGIRDWTRKSHAKLASIDQRLAWLQDFLKERRERRPPIAMECPACRTLHTGDDQRYCRVCGVELKPIRAEKKPVSK